MCLSAACGHIQAYEAELRAREEASAARPMPAPTLSHAARTIHLRAYADAEYREQNPNWRAHAEEMVEVANLLVGPQLDTALHLDGTRSWDRECTLSEHDACIAELTRLGHESNRPEGRRNEHWLWSVRRVGWEGDTLLNGDNAENRRRLAVIDIETKGPAAAKRTVYANVRPSVDLPEDRAFYRRRVNLHFQDVDAGYQSRAVVDGGHFQLPL